MAKKTDKSTKPDAPITRAVKPTAKTAKTVKAGKSAKTVAAKRKIATKPPKPLYTREDVALRAYFISEKRHAHGLPGNEHQDWLEAERQLTAESSGAKKTKKS